MPREKNLEGEFVPQMSCPEAEASLGGFSGSYLKHIEFKLQRPWHMENSLKSARPWCLLGLHMVEADQQLLILVSLQPVMRFVQTVAWRKQLSIKPRSESHRRIFNHTLHKDLGVNLNS